MSHPLYQPVIVQLPQGWKGVADEECILLAYASYFPVFNQAEIEHPTELSEALAQCHQWESQGAFLCASFYQGKLLSMDWYSADQVENITYSPNISKEKL